MINKQIRKTNGTTRKYKRKAIMLEPRDMQNPAEQCEAFSESLSKEMGAGKQMLSKLKAAKIGSDIQEYIKDAGRKVKKNYMQLKALCNAERTGCAMYISIMTEAKKEYKELKRYITIGNAMIRAADKKSKKSTKKEKANASKA